MSKDDSNSNLLLLDEKLEVVEELTESPSTPSASSSTPESSDNSHTASLCASPDEDGEARVPATSAVFFARVPPTVLYEELHDLFSKYGAVQHLNLFRRWATAKTSKGCGIVHYSTVDEANSALHALNGIHSFQGYPGCEGPMVVERMDPSRLTSPSEHTGPKTVKANKERPSASRVLGKRWGKAATITSSNSSSNWQRQQQQHSQQLLKHHVGSATLAAAAGCNAFLPMLGGVHPAMEMMNDISSCLPSFADGMSTLTTAAAGFGSTVPVHLLPIRCNKAQTGPGCSSLPQLNPLVSPATVAAAAAAVTNPLSAVRLEQLPKAASPASSGCPTPTNLDPWLSGALASNTDSSNLSLTSHLSGFAPVSNSLLAAAQQQLLLLDDAWVAEGCEGCTSTASSLESSIRAATGAFNAGTYSLFDSSGPLCGVSGAAAAAACPACLFGSSSSSSVQSEASGLLPMPAFTGGLIDSLAGGVSGVLGDSAAAAVAAATSSQVAEGFLPTHSCHSMALPGSATTNLNIAAAVAAPNAAGSVLLQQQQLHESMHLELCDSSLCQVAAHIPHVAKMSGVEVSITAGPSGMQLHLQGSAAQLDMACSVLRLLLLHVADAA